MLIQLFSETELLLKPIMFLSGINIILGKYSGKKEEKGINGIGKSSLVRLINYALLSSSAERKFSDTKYDFLRNQNHNIVLEFKIQNTTYFIKRYFAKQDIILFGNNFNKLEEFGKLELKTILGNKFFPFQNEEIFFEGERYGTLMDFFIKDDLKSQTRVDPINFSSGTSTQILKSIFNFFLFGLPTRNIIRYGDISEEYEKFNKTVNGLITKIELDTGKSIEEFKSERIKMEQNVFLLEGSIKDFTFLENYKTLENELIDITSKINERLKEYHFLNQKLKKIKEAYQFSPEIDIEQIKKLYNEVISTFGNLVSKSLNDVIEFKKEIIENRNKFLISKEDSLQKSIDTILKEISELEQYRSKIYKHLEEKGALESITNTYEQLTKEKTKLAGNIQILTQIDELQEMMGNLNVTINEVKREIQFDIKNNGKIIDSLRSLFIEILENAIDLDGDSASGYFDISSKPSSRRNALPFEITTDITKSDALGQSRLKIITYDLMIFLKNIRDKRDIPQFLIHDGVYHGISRKTTIKALNYIYHQHLAYPNFQYIVTFNEDEIDFHGEEKDKIGDLEFAINDVVIAELSDNPAGMLFKRDFK